MPLSKAMKRLAATVQENYEIYLTAMEWPSIPCAIMLREEK